MYLREDNLKFRDQSNRGAPFRLLAWATLSVFGLWLVFQIQANNIEPLFLPTPTPTRTAFSWSSEGKTLFESGDLDGSISAYREALVLEPDATQIWTELAQIQTYSSSLLTTDAERYQRLQEAMASVDRALELDYSSSTAHAIRAFILNWMASPNYGFDAEQRARMLNEAEGEAVAASQFDRQNLLAQVYYAEVLLDQQKWTQAFQTIEQVLERDQSLMDAHRVHGLILETFGQYSAAIRAYEKAAVIMPNLTFLYIYMGRNYRQLELYEYALEYFAKAAAINERNQVLDPLPYIAIARTYAQQGEFFIAARNAEKALSVSPYNPNTYGQLGDIYVRARNYEGALPVLKCAVYGCTAEENEVGETQVEGLPLSSIEVAYYYLRYGSVLASLNMCDEAEPVLAQVMESYGWDTTIAAIVTENHNICRILRGTP